MEAVLGTRGKGVSAEGLNLGSSGSVGEGGSCGGLKFQVLSASGLSAFGFVLLGAALLMTLHPAFLPCWAQLWGQGDLGVTRRGVPALT